LRVVDEFFREIDRRWSEPATDRITLNIIGSSALMLQADYERGTRDSDVLATELLTSPIKDALLALAGSGTTLARKHGLYLQIVGNGIPFLPREPLWHQMPSLDLKRFQVRALDVVDVIDRGLVDHERLVERFRSAFVEFSYDSRAAELKDYVDHLHRVERDMFHVEESDFESDLSLLRY
jgi:hypothetical protein